MLQPKISVHEGQIPDPDADPTGPAAVPMDRAAVPTGLGAVPTDPDDDHDAVPGQKGHNTG